MRSKLAKGKKYVGVISRELCPLCGNHLARTDDNVVYCSYIKCSYVVKGPKRKKVNR